MVRADARRHDWEIVSAWLAGGLSAGERVMYFEDDSADVLFGRLTDDRVPTDRARADGQFVLVPTEQTRATMTAPLDVFEELIVGLVRETEEGGWPGLRLVGENISVQRHQGLDTVLAYESVVDQVLRAHPTARLLCRFDRQHFDDEAMAAVRAVHATELRAPGPSTTTACCGSPGPVRRRCGWPGRPTTATGRSSAGSSTPPSTRPCARAPRRRRSPWTCRRCGPSTSRGWSSWCTPRRSSPTATTSC